MKKVALFLIIPLLAFAQDKKEEKSDEKKTPEVIPATTAKNGSSQKGVMIIDPEARVKDLTSAYEKMKNEKISTSVYFQLANGRKISNIIDITPLPQNTLVLFRYNTGQGINFEVVPTEDILGIFHQ